MTLRFAGTTPTGLSVGRMALDRGEIVGLSGPSGAGKSRLMRALADLDAPDGMSISLDGVARRSIPAADWRRRVLYCPAAPAWWEDDRIDRLFRDRAGRALLEAFDLSATLWPRPLNQLSSGEQQRAHLARHLAMTPDVLMLDEPTSALDQAAAAKAEDLIRNASRRAAVLLISHDPAQLDRLAGRRWRIRDGRLEAIA